MTAPVVHGRKLAWIPDRIVVAEMPDHMRAERLLAGAPVPVSSSNGDLAPVVLDQGGLGACVGNGTNEGALAEMIRAGAPAPVLGSRLWTYYLARAADNDTANDDGCQIHNAFAAIERYGLPSEEVWPYSDASGPGAPFARMPAPEVWRAAFDATLGLKAHRITSSGAARVDDVKRALGQRRPVVFGADVSTDFCAGRFDPTVALTPPDGLSIAGGHCQLILDHQGDVFRVRNSWSAEWGDAGSSRWSADYIASGYCSDLWLFDAMPKSLGGAL